MCELCVDQCEYYDNGRCLGTREMDSCNPVNCPKNKKTTEQMTNFETGAVRDTGGKGRMDLIPWCAIIRVSKHMEDALAHYPERNWEKGLPMHSMVDSAFRHLAKYTMGMKDEDHLCAAATNLLMAMWTEEKLPEMQDIPNRTGNTGNTLPAEEGAIPLAQDHSTNTSVPQVLRGQGKPRESLS